MYLSCSRFKITYFEIFSFQKYEIELEYENYREKSNTRALLQKTCTKISRMDEIRRIATFNRIW